MQSRQLLSIVLSLIMFTGVSVGGVYAQTNTEVELEDNLDISVDEDTIEEELDDDANETDEIEIEIEVEIEDGIAKIKIEIEDEESRFEIDWVDEQTTIEEIALRTDLPIEQISSLISFEFEVPDEEDENDNEQTRPEKLAEKLAKEEEKLAEREAKQLEKQTEREDKLAEKQTKREAKLAEKHAKAEAKLVRAQERLAEKLSKLEVKLTEKANISEERANKILEKIAKETQKTDERVQKLLEKLQSGKYFGNIKNPDAVTKSFTLSFEGAALDVDDSSVVSTVNGELFLENQATGNISKKFRVTGGELFIGETEVFDVVFGKARLSSSGPGGEKDSMILVAQTSDGVDIRTLKLSIDLSEEIDSETESATVEILSPQSKIASLWFLSGTGSLILTESAVTPDTETETDDSETDDTTVEDIPHTTAITVSTLQDSYVTGDEIIISGTVEEIFEDTPVILQTVTASDLIEIAQIDVTSNGEFTHSIQATGPQWLSSETYTVKAFYGGNNVAETTFEFSIE